MDDNPANQAHGLHGPAALLLQDATRYLEPARRGTLLNQALVRLADCAQRQAGGRDGEQSRHPAPSRSQGEISSRACRHAKHARDIYGRPFRINNQNATNLFRFC